MGLPAWERRVYLKSGKAGCVETTGVGAPKVDAAALRVDQRAIADDTRGF